jgi:AcrR family transcriptional regulator
MKKSLLFHYFGSKEGLFTFLYRYASGRVAESLKRFRYQDKEDLFEMIRRANAIKLELFRAHPYLYKFFYSAYFEQDGAVQEIVRGQGGEQVAAETPVVVEHMDKTRLRRGLAPEQALQIILWVSEGFLEQKLQQGSTDPERLEQEFNEWMAVLKHCLYEEDQKKAAEGVTEDGNRSV